MVRSNPSEWDPTRLKRVATVLMGQSPSSDDCNQEGNGIPFLQGCAEFGDVHPIPKQYCEVAPKISSKGDLLFSVRAPVGSINISDQKYGIGRGLCAIHGSSISHDFLKWSLEYNKTQLNAMATGSTYEAVTINEVCNIEIAKPSENEQKWITNFLDRETAKLDTLIAKQEKLIERINERIIATVMTAMTSIETQYVRFVYACDVISRPVNQALNDSFVRLGVLNRGRGLFKREETDSEDMGDSDFFWVKKGDLILSGQFAWEGSVAMAEDEHDGCVVSHRFPIINGKLGVASTEYLLALLMSPHGDFLLNENSRGSAGRNRPLNLSLLLKEKIPIASVTVQNEVTKLMTLRRKLIEKVQLSIELAEEHRTALISAAVNGKIDVREAAITDCHREAETAKAHRG